MKLTGIVAILYIAGVTVSVIVLTMLIHTMDITDKRWEATGFFLNSETLSQTNAKDTSESSFRNVVEQIQKIGNVLKNITKGIESIETKRQVIKENQPVRKFCRIPKPNTIYPLCEDKVEYVRQFWNFRCYAEQNNVRNTDLCSILIYLSEVEKWCPRLPWRTVPTSLKTKQETIREKTTIQGNLDDLVRNVLYDTAYKWMRNRITSMKGDWESALSSISEKRDLTKRSKKKILVFLGAFAFVPMIFEQAFSGGPLGELLQWTDVITSLYLLGHELTIIKDTKKLKRVIPLPDEYGCINKDMERQSKYDLIFTDITGVQFMTQTVGPHLSELRCKFRVLDSFGTEARFNFGKFSDYDEKLKSLWGGLDLNLRQFMTMFPHSPDNSFIGFVSGARKPGNKKFTKKDKALVYGKVDYYWIVGNKKYLDQIHKHVEIHGTFNESLGKRPDYIPRYVINHGVVEGSTIQNMLKESKVFVGLGFPFEGPAPLEAIANGAAFLNPKFSEPRNRYNTNFFAGKPTSRSLTSQNPYAETFIGEPYVYTIDINNSTDVELAMRKIMKTSLDPYIPHEYTHEGMLERVSAQVENLDFCQDSRWPPLQNLVQVKGPLGQSCKDACWKKGLLCEPTYWNIVNQLISFRREGITCEDIQYVERTIAPSYQPKSKRCYFQKQPLLYSCVSSDDTHLRLCPCRDFVKDQVALCKGCW